MEKIVVDKEKNQVKLLFNSSFYANHFIDKAIEDFNRICNIKKIENMILIEPKVTIDAEILGYEFYNYVLGLIKNS